MREDTKDRVPEPGEPGRQRNIGVDRGEELIRGQPRQSLNVAHGHHRLRRYGIASGGRDNCVVDVVDAKHRERAQRTSGPGGGNLGIGERGVHANTEQYGGNSGEVVEELRVGEGLDGTNGGAAEIGYAPDRAEAEMVEEDAEAPAHYRLGQGRPSEPRPRTEVVLGLKLRVVVPAQP